MKKQAIFTLFLCLFFGLGNVQSQTNIKVPDKIKFADMQLTLTKEAQDAVQKKVNGLTRSQRFYEDFIERCNVYFPVIEEVFAEQKLPEDFKYLALQESALIPDAVSRSNAVGFWQFKDGTAREQGLRVDNTIDERKNIATASVGAAKYLKKNNFFLKNWVYALLSYNLGLTGANNISDRSYIGATKMEINVNTHIYIIHFLAHKIAFEGAVGRSSSLTKLLEYPQAKGKSLNEISKISGIEEDDLIAYNRWFRGDKVPTYSTPFFLPAPAKKEKELIAKLELDKKGNNIGEPDGGKTDKPNGGIADGNKKKGDYPKITNPKKRKIAGDDITFASINGIPGFITGKKPNMFEITSTLDVSRKKFMKYNDLSIVDEIEPNAVYYLKNKKRKAQEDFHVTQRGETLAQIAQDYGIKEKSLVKFNRMRQGEEPQPGRVLWLKKKRPRKTPIEIRDLAPVKEEDKKNDGGKDDGKKDGTELGNILSIIDEEKNGKGGNEPEKVITDGRFHIVRKGEGLFAIGREYQVTVPQLDQWNSLNGNHSLREGQILLVKDPNKTEDGKDLKSLTNTDDIDKLIDEVTIDRDGNVVDTTLKNIFTGGDNNGGFIKKPDTGGTSMAIGGKTHTVSPGDNLYSIARKYNVSHLDIIKWNNISQADVLAINTKLLVEDPSTKFGTSGGANVTPNLKNAKVHKIASGETLYGISRQYAISVADITQWNDLDRNSKLSVGQELYIENPSSFSKAVTPVADQKPIIHIVRASDNLNAIAYRYGTSVDEIKRINKIGVGDILVEGQSLLIKTGTPAKVVEKPVTVKPEAKTEVGNKTYKNMPQVYVVRSGDAIWNLAKGFGVSVAQLREWNSLTSDEIRPNQRLIVGYKQVEVKSNGPNVSKAKSDNSGSYIDKTKAESTFKYHLVKSGDTLYSIAKANNLTVDQLKILNPGISASLGLNQKVRVR